MHEEKEKNYIEQSVKRLDDISRIFAGEIGRRPSSHELLEILGWALISLPESALEDFNPRQIASLRPQVKKNAKPFQPWASTTTGNSEVGSLNDSIFVVANDFLLDLTHAIKADTGNPPTLNGLAALLTEGLHDSKDTLLIDLAPSDIQGIKIETLGKQKISVNVGDIVAIPALDGKYFIALVLSKDAFGLAFGLFQGSHQARPLSINAHPPTMKYPIHSDDRLIVKKQWRIVGHNADLCVLFPAEPEIYHYPRTGKGYEKIGPYGSGETASGKLRDLTHEEAEEIGLLNESYRPFYMSEHLGKFLNSKLGLKTG